MARRLERLTHHVVTSNGGIRDRWLETPDLLEGSGGYGSTHHACAQAQPRRRHQRLSPRCGRAPRVPARREERPARARRSRRGQQRSDLSGPRLASCALTRPGQRQPPNTLMSATASTACHVVPPSAIYGRLMPRGAGFCHVLAALSWSGSPATPATTKEKRKSGAGPQGHSCRCGSRTTPERWLGSRRFEDASVRSTRTG